MSDSAPRPEVKTSASPGSAGPPPIAPLAANELPAGDATNRMRPPGTPADPPQTRALGNSGSFTPALDYLPRVNGYELLEELGRGGMGVVYKAWQHSLQRYVALKMILAGAFAAESDIERFRTEAVAVAKLRHPYLLNIYEIGYQDGLPFFSMEYLDGGSLTHFLNGRPQPARVCASLVEKLAQAMDYAHQKGVIHRDLKPANVLFLQVERESVPRPAERAVPADERGKLSGSGSLSATLSLDYLVPKITDFGLAKQVHQDHFLTRTGDILGTPAYMAPEQAAGKNELVGPRTDVYSLGAILYELITGTLLFQDASPAETLLKVTQEEPTPPRKIQRSIPVDLETICLKCLEKDPAKRYPTAGELAADLGRFLAGESVVARKPSVLSRMVKWVKRHPAKTVLGVTSLLIVALAFGWIATSLRNAQLEAENEKAASAARAKALMDTERLLGEALLDRGLFMAERGDEARGLHWMLRSLEMMSSLEDKLGDKIDFSVSVKRSLASWTHQYIPKEAVLNHDGWVWTVAFSPDGKLALTGGRDSVVRVWDATTGKLLDRLNHPLPVWGMVFEPSGRFLFTLSGDNKESHVRVFENVPDERILYREKGDHLKLSAAAIKLDKKGKAILVLAGMDPSASQIRIDKNGKRLLVTTHSKNALLFDFNPAGANNGLKLISNKIAHRATILTTTFSPDGATIYTGSVDGVFAAWDAHTGVHLDQKLLNLPGRIEAIHPSSDGRVVAIACSRRFPIDPPSPAPPMFSEQFVHPDPKGNRHDGLVVLYDMQAAKPLVQPITLTQRVKSLALTRDGDMLLAGCYQTTEDVTAVLSGEVRFLHARGRSVGKPAGKTIPHPSNIWDMKISPDGQLLLTGCEDAKARLFNLADQMPVGQPMSHEGNVVQVAFHPRGYSMLTASAGGADRAGARLWDVPLPSTWGKPLSHFALDESGRRVPHPVVGVVWEPDGEHVWTAAQGEGIRRWHAPTGVSVDQFVLEGGVQPAELTLLDGGKSLLVAGEDGSVTRYDAATREKKRIHPPQQAETRSLCLVMPNGDSFLLINQADGVTHRYATRTGERLGHELKVDANVSVAAISSDGGYLATSVYAPHDLRSHVVVRELPMGEVVQRWEFPNQTFALAFTPDSTALVSGGEDKLVQFWDLKTGKLNGPPLMHNTPVMGMTFSPDGKVLATASRGGPTRLWDVVSSRPLGKPLLVGHNARKSAFRPDGKLLLVGSENDGQGHFFLVPSAFDGRPSQVRLWVEILTGMEMTSSDAIVPLSPDALSERRLQFHDGGGSPYRP